MYPSTTAKEHGLKNESLSHDREAKRFNYNYVRVIDPGFITTTSLIQLGYGIWVNLSHVNLGLAIGFSAVTIPQLALPDSLIHPTLSEESWITSVLTLFAPVGCLICGLLMDKLGRRPMMILGNLPVSIGWFYTAMAASAFDMIIGRIITGVGGGMIMACPRAYLTEISLPNMRGVIGSMPNLALALGITGQAGLSIFWPWRIMCFFCGIFSTTIMCLNYFLPETPYFILMRGTVEMARENLRKFRGKLYPIDEEMEELIEYKNNNDIHRLSFSGEMKALITQSSCKPFALIVPYILFAQLSGVSIVMFWTIDMLQSSRSSVQPRLGNVLISVTRLFSGLITSILLFKVGKRPLALISALGIFIVCISLGIFIKYAKEPNVFPQIAYMLYVLLGSLGYYTLPPMIMFEIYPLQVRGLLGGISISIINVAMFGVNKSYPYVRNAIGFPLTVIAFGCWSLLGSIYLFFFLPETKGLTLQEIEEYFNNRRSTLRSERDIMMGQLTGTIFGSSSTINLTRGRSLHRHKVVKTKKLKEDKQHTPTESHSDPEESKKETVTSKTIAIKDAFDNLIPP